MSTKKKYGLGCIVGGACFIVAGILGGFTKADIGVLYQVFSIIGLVAGALGVTITFPGEPPA